MFSLDQVLAQMEDGILMVDDGALSNILSLCSSLSLQRRAAREREMRDRQVIQKERRRLLPLVSPICAKKKKQRAKRSMRGDGPVGAVCASILANF